MNSCAGLRSRLSCWSLLEALRSAPLSTMVLTRSSADPAARSERAERAKVRITAASWFTRDRDGTGSGALPPRHFCSSCRLTKFSPSLSPGHRRAPPRHRLSSLSRYVSTPTINDGKIATIIASLPRAPPLAGFAFPRASGRHMVRRSAMIPQSIIYDCYFGHVGPDAFPD